MLFNDTLTVALGKPTVPEVLIPDNEPEFAIRSDPAALSQR